MVASTQARDGEVIASIYRPVQDEMDQLESRLDDLIAGAPEEVADKLDHALKGGGKRLRPALVLLSGSVCPGKLESLVSMAVAYELFHTATLVHDDTIDNAFTRRGKVTVNQRWSNSTAVFLGDYLCGCSALMAAETDNLRAMEIFSEALADICNGAIAEHASGWRKGREEYFDTIGRKTAALFSGATESGGVLSKASKKTVCALKSYGRNLGMAFQMVDDIHDFVSDMSRGSITLPAILLLEQPHNSWVADVLEKDPQTGLGLLTEMVKDSCVLEDCYQMARGFSSQARSALDTLPEGDVCNSLRSLVDFIVDREP
jgi:geranylgeranyl pyrophosphate synthase